MQKPTLTLPADEYIDVRDLPEMLAVAKYPDPGEYQQVTGLWKDDGALRDLDEKDWETLLTVWKELPRPEFPISDADWHRYADAFNASQSKLTWDLVPKNARSSNAILRAAASEKYREGIVGAVIDDYLEVRDALTWLPQPMHNAYAVAPFREEAFTQGGYVVTRQSLEKFAIHIGFTVTASISRVSSSRKEKSYLGIIAAMRALLRDKDGGGFPSEAKIIDQLTARYKAVSGISKRNLETVFRDATRIMDDAIPPE